MTICIAYRSRKPLSAYAFIVTFFSIIVKSLNDELFIQNNANPVYILDKKQ